MLLDGAEGVKAAPARIANLLHHNGTSVSGISPAAPELVDGIGMTCELVRRIAGDGAPAGRLRPGRGGPGSANAQDRPLDADVAEADRLLPGPDAV